MKSATVLRFFKTGVLKKWLLTAAFIAGIHAGAAAQSAGKVEVSLNFARQNGFATNQFAIWVEDAQGRFVKTLYATQFTASGGWKTREQSLPLWVKQSGISRQSQNTSAKADAVTGPTPKDGSLKYSWDATDSNNRALPAGEYRIFVEASLRNENRVLYTANIRLGGSPGQITPQPSYFGSSSAERGMIGAVTVKY
ncbi:MAG: DUF2271 domain-containing protein [Spirochaetaceae bacterium]|jgi:hypothetical protein|nr:DUF2271 domain-containing protein [Spirochaetaceae bacterium]